MAAVYDEGLKESMRKWFERFGDLSPTALLT